jgi:hypothetical protein
MLAVWCHKRKATPKQVRADAKMLADFQRLLTAQGIEVEWPEPIRYR